MSDIRWDGFRMNDPLAYALYDTKRNDFVRVEGAILHSGQKPIEDFLTSGSEWTDVEGLSPRVVCLPEAHQTYTRPEPKEDPAYMVDIPDDL